MNSLECFVRVFRDALWEFMLTMHCMYKESGYPCNKSLRVPPTENLIIT